MVQLSELHTLDRAECLELLRTVTVGRIAFTERGLPAIQPVNFTVDGSNVIIRTSGGGKLAAAVTGAMVAFEADEVDAITRSGWSVVVAGHASLIRDIDQWVALAEPDSHPWVPGRSNHVIRIKAERITGRRIVPAGRGAPEGTGKQGPSRWPPRPKSGTWPPVSGHDEDEPARQGKESP